MMPSIRSVFLLLLVLSEPSFPQTSSEDQRGREEAFIKTVLADQPEPILEALKQGANVNQITGTGQTILCAASMLGKTKAVKVLIDHGAQLLDSCVVSAVANGHAEIVALFLDRGKSPDILTGESQDTLLHLAVRSGYVDVTELLVARGADSKIKNEDGQTPRDLAQQGIQLLEAISEVLQQAEED
ncbi:ankyrin repeat domain-containing protein [Thiothrix eikelboomii]|uniref:Ankyrin repeat-containing protein n=1 Tax=Thiothrix eikelboomii TaxID=92487 RepID=A0A1T4X1C8_9GAMM|nr:ankyrin repeat domain-containing protein [Thiothrix eikelboomii]SKA83392.1 Ankyrin repeat-containing protein [Thiothrix eikelboomii]